MVGDGAGGGVRASVAMATYNGARHIKEQLDSILCQLGEEDELVVSDDGSRDGTLGILREYAGMDARIRLVKGPGQGVKQNFGNALGLTRGRHIFLADQDDIWEKGKLRRVLDAFGETGASVVVHDAVVFEGEDPGQVLFDSFFEFRGAGPGVVRNIVKNSYIGCCMAFRRELLDYALPIPGGIEMHDQWIGVLGDYAFGKSCFLREPLLRYRRHGDNASPMRHYGPLRMARNRAVFLACFLRRAARGPQRAGIAP